MCVVFHQSSPQFSNILTLKSDFVFIEKVSLILRSTTMQSNLKQREAMARNRIQENGLGVSSYLGLPFKSYLGLPKTMQYAQFPFYIYIFFTMSSYLGLPKTLAMCAISILYCILYLLLSTALFCSKYCFALYKQMITCQGGTSPQGRKIMLELAPCWTPTLWPPRPPRCCGCGCGCGCGCDGCGCG